MQQVSARQLESGSVLYYPELTFHLLETEEKWMQNTPALSAKNISFNPLSATLKGIRCTQTEAMLLKHLCQRFYLQTKTLLDHLFPFYSAHLETGMTSFRPAEIAGRIASSYKKDDTRLHVDAFPSRPNQGKRILRVFSNVNTQGKDRIWRVGEPFASVLQHFFSKLKRPSSANAWVQHKLGLTKGLRTAYDHYMLQLHDQMKADMTYQRTVDAKEVHFAAGSTWIVFTDCVSHAALSGQHALEQTFYLPVSAMVMPEYSPLRMLEGLAKQALARNF